MKPTSNVIDETWESRLGLAQLVVFVIGGSLGLAWCFGSPPIGSALVNGEVPDIASNDPAHSVYLGQGCFWHTQYDFVVIEQDEWGRSDEEVTSLVGYAGGRYQSADGEVCYHGVPSTDYGKLGHGEAVSVSLTVGGNRTEEMLTLASHYFSHGFQETGAGWLRLDPQDAGPEYRNVIGVPGGVDGELFAAIEEANVNDMPLLEGKGGPPHGDDRDEYVVYIYDSEEYAFFRGETYHQFHTNDVLGRYVPPSYTDALKSTQREAGRLGSTGCPETQAASFLVLLLPFIFIVVTCYGLSGLWKIRLRYLLMKPSSSPVAASGKAAPPRRQSRGGGGGGGGGGQTALAARRLDGVV